MFSIQRHVRIGILGAGVSGLTLNYYLKKLLAQRQVSSDISLIEKSFRPGGVIWTEDKDGFTLEHGPDCFLSEKKTALELVDDLGLTTELVGTRPEFRRSYILKGNALHPVPEGLYLMAPTKLWPFAFSPLMSLKGKIRALKEPFISKRTPKDGEDETLAAFVRRRFGQELLEAVAQPMIAGIYTADPEQLSLKSTMPRFQQLEQTYGSVIRGLIKQKMRAGTSGPRYSLFVSFQSGMGAFTQKLLSHVTLPRIYLNQDSSEIRFDGRKWLVSMNKDVSEEFDLLVSCLPAYEITKLLSRQFDEVQKLTTPDYASTAILHFAFENRQLGRPFGGMGFVVPHREKKIIMAGSFLSHKFLNRSPENHVLIRVFCGGKLNENLMTLSDEHLTASALSELRQILSIDGSPLFSTVKRWSRRMPQYTVGHSQRIQDFEKTVSNIPQFYASGNFFSGVGIPDVIEKAKKTAERLVSEL